MLGSSITSLALHKRLGTAITSLPGDVWHINLDRGGNIQCFSATRTLKDGKSAHVRFLADMAEDPKAMDELLAAIMAWAMENKVGNLHTNDRRGADVYARAGFTALDTRSGDFIRWDRNLETRP